VIARVLLFTLFATYSAFGQLQWQLLQVDAAGNETPICNSQQTCTGIELGSTATGTALTETFHLKNTGSTQADVDILSVTGTGFQLVLLNSPSIPVTLMPQAALYFQIVFTSNTAGNASGSLTINNGGPYPLSASATGGGGAQPNPSVTPTPSADPVVVNSTTGVTIPAGGIIDFGNVQTSSSTSFALLLENQSSTNEAVTSLAVAGSGFSGSGNSVPPFAILPNNQVQYILTFTPPSAGSFQGQLTLNDETFVLTGTAVASPSPTPPGGQPSPSATPEPQILITDNALGINRQPVPDGQSITLASSNQVQLDVHFSTQYSTNANGTASIQLCQTCPQGSTGVCNNLLTDSGVTFILSGSSPPLTSLPFNVNSGDSDAHFNGSPYATFQTGTTAGAILVTVSMGQTIETACIDLPSGPISLGPNYPTDPENSPVTAKLSASSILLKIAAFDNTHATCADNTRSASFSFYDTSHNLLGSSSQDLSALFNGYFCPSSGTPADGGVFELTATFPVSGDVSRIASMDIILSNLQGATAGLTDIPVVPAD
jgi:hypothetical protein